MNANDYATSELRQLSTSRLIGLYEHYADAKGLRSQAVRGGAGHLTFP